MTTTKQRIDQLYVQVLSRLGGDQQESKALLDELLFLLASAVAGRGGQIFGEERPGPKGPSWEEIDILWAKVEALRKPPKRLSIRKALEQIAYADLANSGKSQYNKDARKKAMQWVKTMENTLCVYRPKREGALKVISEHMSSGNIYPTKLI